MRESTRTLRRVATAGAAALALVAAVATCMGHDSRDGLLEEAATVAGASLVFTSVDARRVYKSEIQHAEGREAAFEAHVEALRRLAAQRHEQHERALSREDDKNEERVIKLDGRKLPRVFVSRDGAAAVALAGARAAHREQKLQARIDEWKELEDKEHTLHEQQVKGLKNGGASRKQELQAQAQQNLEQSVPKPAERIQRETDAFKYAAAKERQFEAEVKHYRKAEHEQLKTLETHPVAGNKARHAAVSERAERVTAGASSGFEKTGDAAKGVGALDRALRRDASLGIAAVQKTLDEQARRHEVERQTDFKKRVAEESRKAREMDKQRKAAAVAALEKLHAQAKARKEKEAAKRMAWEKKKQEREAVAKMLATTRDREWPSGV